MKKVLLSALSLSLIGAASAADVEGFYKAATWSGATAQYVYPAEDMSLYDEDEEEPEGSYQLVDTWSNEDSSSWRIKIGLGEEDSVALTNLLNWGEFVHGTVSSDGTITIPAGTVIYENTYVYDGEEYTDIYQIGQSPWSETIDGMDSNGCWFDPTELNNVIVRVKDGKLEAMNVVIYNDYSYYYAETDPDYHIALCYEVLESLVADAYVPELLPEEYTGELTTAEFAGWDYDDNGKFTISWSNEDVAPWTVTIEANEDGTVSLSGLIDWGETIDAEYDAENGSIVIPANTEFYAYDEEGNAYPYVITGAYPGYTVNNLNKEYEGLLVDDDMVYDVVGKLEGGKIVFNPFFICWDYANMGWAGLYSVEQAYDSLVLAKEGKVNAVVADQNAPVEFFNLQGIRVAQPANGVYIRRQGNVTTKVLVK